MGRALMILALVAVWGQPALAETPWRPMQAPASDGQAAQHRFDPLTGQLVPVGEGTGAAQPGRMPVHVTPHAAPFFDPRTGQFNTQGEVPQTRYNPHTGQWETTQPGVTVDFEIKDPPAPQR